MPASTESPTVRLTSETPGEYLRRLGRSLICFVVLAGGLFSMLSALGCRSVAPVYDAQVISATERLGADADALLARAKEPFDRHALEAAGIRNRLASMIKAAQARGRGNVGVVAQWEIIAQPRAKGGQLLGAMLDEWETNAVLEEPLLTHRRAIVREAFKAVLIVERDRPAGVQERLAMEQVYGEEDPVLPADPGEVDAALFEGGAQ